MRFRGANPVYSRMGDISGSGVSATYGGVTLKTGFLLGIIAIIALYFGSTLDFDVNPMGMIFTVFGSAITAFIMVILVHRNVELAWIFSIIYAACEGIFLGFISAIFASYIGSNGVLMALLATFGVLTGMLLLYSTGLIRVGSGFRQFMFSALMGIIFATFIMIIISLFGGFDTRAGYSFYVTIVLASVVISSLYLLVDFKNITELVNAGAGKEYEWGLALGLVVTIIWLYVELLRLILIITGRRK